MLKVEREGIGRLRVFEVVDARLPEGRWLIFIGLMGERGRISERHWMPRYNWNRGEGQLENQSDSVSQIILEIIDPRSEIHIPAGLCGTEKL